MWLFTSASFITLFPLYESRESLSILFTSMLSDISGKSPENVEINEKIQETLENTAHGGSMESIEVEVDGKNKWEECGEKI
jgi:hypothetical protein